MQGCESVTEGALPQVCFNNDIDGDGLLNYVDPDSDGDGMTNYLEYRFLYDYPLVYESGQLAPWLVAESLSGGKPVDQPIFLPLIIRESNLPARD